MSVQFGIWNFEPSPVAPAYLDGVREQVSPFAPDAGTSYTKEGVSILVHAFRTTKESRHETQPHLAPSGSVLVWDGRLDNRTDLLHDLNGALPPDSPDVSIVHAVYEQWGNSAFGKLLGDWALSLWSPINRKLILAKDFAGTRPLHYIIDHRHVTWCTLLSPLVLLANRSWGLDEDYIAECFIAFPAADRTPYLGVRSVPPASFVVLGPRHTAIRKHWDFSPDKQIRYRSDREYEEQFRTVFETSVERRLRSDAPVLAELSGGMDSSSIVCAADCILEKGRAETPRLDTLSYYSDFEPDWDERPFFTKVEERRGRTGCHIEVTSEDVLPLDWPDGRFAATPSSCTRPSPATRHFVACVASQGNRVVLSGIGGDEVLGGVPTPLPELADLLAAGTFTLLPHRLRTWALQQRRPWTHLLWDTARLFLPSGAHARKDAVPWLTPGFKARHRDALAGYRKRLELFGALPSFQENLSTLEALRRRVASFTPSAEPPLEKRYPYLDRDLLEFLYALPPEQLVRPGQRRSLMRRSLVGIVPDELLNRKRKPFVTRTTFDAISKEWDSLSQAVPKMKSCALGIVDPDPLRETLLSVKQGREVPIVPLLRTLRLEAWLSALLARGIVSESSAFTRPSVGGQRQILIFSAENNPQKKGGDTHELSKA